MIFSIIEKVSEHDNVQKVMVKGKTEEIAVEMENIFAELIKRGFPEELLIVAVLEAAKCKK